MVIFDKDEQRIVVRVVYDGPARAGKTTNLKRLCDHFTRSRRSELEAYGDSVGRTLFFEWLQLDGGLVGGFPLRGHFVTVPGQAVLDHRRRPLLEGADAVVFVCESHPRSLRIARRMLDDLMDPATGAFRVPVVIQANKQDIQGALAPKDLLARLGLPPETPVVAARAAEGAGVREAMTLGLRAAANRAERALIDRGIEGVVGEAESHAALHERLRAVPEPSAEAKRAILMDRLESIAPVPFERTPVWPTVEAPLGHVWPAGVGRKTLADLARSPDGASPFFLSRGVPGGEARAQETGLTCTIGSWRLHTSERRCFKDPAQARAALRVLSARFVGLGALVARGTTLCLAQGVGEWWLWTLTPTVPTLEERLRAAVDEGEDRALDLVLALFADTAAECLGLAAERGIFVALDPRNFGAHEGRIVCFDDEAPMGAAVPPITSLLTVADACAPRDGAVSGYARALEAAILVRLSAKSVRSLGLIEDLQRAPARTPAARAVRSRLLDALSTGGVPALEAAP